MQILWYTGIGNNGPLSLPTWDNAIYELANGGSPSHITAAAPVTTSYEREETESSMEERKFDNFMCSDDETDHDDSYEREKTESSMEERRFDNIIYAGIDETYHDDSDRQNQYDIPR